MNAAHAKAKDISMVRFKLFAALNKEGCQIQAVALQCLFSNGHNGNDKNLDKGDRKHTVHSSKNTGLDACWTHTPDLG